MSMMATRSTTFYIPISKTPLTLFQITASPETGRFSLKVASNYIVRRGGAEGRERISLATPPGKVTLKASIHSLICAE